MGWILTSNPSLTSGGCPTKPSERCAIPRLEPSSQRRSSTAEHVNQYAVQLPQSLTLHTVVFGPIYLQPGDSAHIQHLSRSDVVFWFVINKGFRKLVRCVDIDNSENTSQCLIFLNKNCRRHILDSGQCFRCDFVFPLRFRMAELYDFFSPDHLINTQNRMTISLVSRRIYV